MDGRHCTAARDEGRTSERARETEEGSGKREREQRRRRLRESRRASEREERAPIHSIVRHGKKLRLNFARTLFNTSTLKREKDLHEIVGVESSQRDVGAKKI